MVNLMKPFEFLSKLEKINLLNFFPIRKMEKIKQKTITENQKNDRFKIGIIYINSIDH